MQSVNLVPNWYKVQEGDATMITMAAVFVGTNTFLENVIFMDKLNK